MIVRQTRPAALWIACPRKQVQTESCACYTCANFLPVGWAKPMPCGSEHNREAATGFCSQTQTACFVLTLCGERFTTPPAITSTTLCSFPLLTCAPGANA